MFYCFPTSNAYLHMTSFRWCVSIWYHLQHIFHKVHGYRLHKQTYHFGNVEFYMLLKYKIIKIHKNDKTMIMPKRDRYIIFSQKWKSKVVLKTLTFTRLTIRMVTSIAQRTSLIMLCWTMHSLTSFYHGTIWWIEKIVWITKLTISEYILY